MKIGKTFVVGLVVFIATGVFFLGVGVIGLAPKAEAANRADYKGFSWGWCTYYAAVEFDKVAPSPGVNWRGNAAQWLANAHAAGWAVATSASAAKVGSIIVWSDGALGHVGIVREVTSTSARVQEMNWTGFGVVSSKTLSKSNLDRGSYKFKGYIYPKLKSAVTFYARPQTATPAKRGVGQTISVLMAPTHAVGNTDVEFRAYKYENGTWTHKFTVKAKVTSNNSVTKWSRYSTTIKFPTAGKWRVRAYHKTCHLYKAGYSPYVYLTVK